MSKQSKRQMGGSGEALPNGVIGEKYTTGSLTTFVTVAANANISKTISNLPPGVYIANLYASVKTSTAVTRGIYVTFSETVPLPNGYPSALTTGPISPNGDSAIPQGFFVSVYFTKTTTSSVSMYIGNYNGNPSVTAAGVLEIIRIA